MTDEEILKFSENYFDENFVEYDELGNEVIDFIATKENLIEFTRAILENAKWLTNKSYNLLKPVSYPNVKIATKQEIEEQFWGNRMSKSYISCYNQDTRELEHFEVPYSVFVYTQQLECEIKYASGGVKKLYDFRFGKNWWLNHKNSHTFPEQFAPRHRFIILMLWMRMVDGGEQKWNKKKKLGLLTLNTGWWCDDWPF
jgi:hypothetical protein